MTSFKNFYLLTEKRKKKKKKKSNRKVKGKHSVFWHGTPLGGYVQHTGSGDNEIGIEDAI